MQLNIIGGNEGAKIYIDNETQKDGILHFDVNMSMESEQIPVEFKIAFSFPSVDMYSVWGPGIRFDRSLRDCNGWKRTSNSRLASWMPLHALVSQDGKNRITIAVSDAKNPIALRTGVREETALMHGEIVFFTATVAPLKEYKATVRMDMRDIAYYDAIYDVVSWWENECGYKPAYVPEHARLPMNSLWYSYHQQLDVEDIIRECVLSKAIGMDTIIVDDGWQTDDNNRGYKFCGDWEVSEAKIPDIKDFVSRVHDTGMKIMLWFSVPFIGTSVKSFELFHDMILDHTGDDKSFFALDPRYKMVRDHLIGIYERAVGEWGFDGLKLDFIDSFFPLTGRSLQFDPRRDHVSVEDAIDTLMTDVSDALRRINPDVLIEFRQTYIGPAIRKYGNMLRVADCPNDAIINRQDVVNLRLTSGGTAVHSDMLMWHPEDHVENAALQLVSVLYSVPQISVKLASLSEDHKKMLEFYLSFWKENREVLIDGKLLAANPETSYSIVCAEKDGVAIFTCYNDTLVDCSAYSDIIAINASRHSALIVKGAASKTYKVLDCMGNELDKGIITADLCEVSIPLSGMVCIK